MTAARHLAFAALLTVSSWCHASGEESGAPGSTATSLPTNTFLLPSKPAAGAEYRRSGPSAAGVVEISQYGAPEDVGTFRAGGYQAVRFDPPFDPPYTIHSVRFPSFTAGGGPAVFPSVRLCAADSRGFVNLTAPLAQFAPYAGAADGTNEVYLDLTVSQSGEIFYWIIEFPPATGSPLPGSFPLLRMDYRFMDEGFFGNSYEFPTASSSIGSLLQDRNIIASMVCVLSPPNQAPLMASHGLGANRIASDSTSSGSLSFTYHATTRIRADGSPAARNALLRTDLLYRPQAFSPWRYVASAGPNRDVIVIDSLSTSQGLWATQEVDRDGHRSISSNVVRTLPFTPGVPGRFDDVSEPNGRFQDATPLANGSAVLDETYWPAGDLDFYSLSAAPGDTVDIEAGRSGADGMNDLELVMFLFDRPGHVIGVGEGVAGGAGTGLRYVVPSIGDRHRFTLMVTDRYGSTTTPESSPRVIFPFPNYVLQYRVTPGARGSQSTRLAPARGWRIVGAGANPTSSSVRFRVEGTGPGGPPRVAVYDVHGRLVRRLSAPLVDEEGATIHWDRTDGTGTGVAPGVYFIRVEGGGESQTKRVVLTK